MKWCISLAIQQAMACRGIVAAQAQRPKLGHTAVVCFEPPFPHGTREGRSIWRGTATEADFRLTHYQKGAFREQWHAEQLGRVMHAGREPKHAPPCRAFHSVPNAGPIDRFSVSHSGASSISTGGPSSACATSASDSR